MTERSAESDVLDANARFYRAFESLSADEMAAVWAEEEPVCCVHPGWPLLSGREAVLESWARIFDNAAVMQFNVTGAAASVAGDWAWVVCTERLTSVQGGHVAEGRIQTTNLFRKQDGRWFMIHHHGSPVA